jgi:hypothetical protein
VYHELLPDIGLIGAQVGLAGGASWNPFEIGRGIQAAGFIDLPLNSRCASAGIRQSARGDSYGLNSSIKSPLRPATLGGLLG